MAREAWRIGNGMARGLLLATAALATFAAAAPARQAAPAAAAPQAAPQVAPRKWEHESSDLPVLPRVKFGALPSGLRYAWLDNPEPKQRVYLRLHVDAGSLAEEESELGMAHFLEHMVFNGSKNFPPGTLVEWLQKHGLGFGGDTNAMTDFSQTIYQLDLPTNDEAMVADGLKVMRDVVDGLLLEQKEIDAEKGVIDGEERERESAQFRATRKAIETLFDGTRVPARMPIGTKAARDAFDSKAMRAFWSRWYRPDLCTLLVVGDLGGRDPAPAIAKAFGDLAAPATPRPAEPPKGAAKLEKRAFVVHDAEIPTEQIHVQLLRPWIDEPDTKATRLRDVALDYARAIVNLRFSELLKKEGTPFLAAQLGEAGGMDVLEGEALYVFCEPAKWQEALAAAQQELRRALQHGFQQAELDEVRADSLRSLEEAVKGEATRDSDSFVAELLAACESRVVPTDAATDRALFEAPLRALTIEQCHAALAKAWSSGQLVIGAIGGLATDEGGEAKLLEAWAKGAKGDVAAGAKTETAAWGYASDPAKAGAVATRAADAALAFEEVVFANGARLIVKKTDFEEREILVRVLVGEGGLSLDPKEAALRFFSQATYLGGGLGRHAIDDIRRLTAGRKVGFDFGIEDDSFVLVGGTTAEDLAMQCELGVAIVTDPGLRDDGATQLRRALPQFYEAQKHQPGGAITLQFLPRLYGGDPRASLPPLEAVQAVTMEQVGGWLKPALADAPITVVMVGDLDVEAAIATTARTFGALPQRRAPKAWEERRAFPKLAGGLRESYAIDTNVPKAMVVVAFGTTDGRDAATRRGLGFLADIVSDRLRVEVREKLGASYSPGAGQETSLVYPGNGRLMMQALGEPAHAQELADACLAVAEKLATDGVTEEEVERLRPELLAKLRDQLRLNAFWFDVLGGLHTGRPVRDDLKTMISSRKEMTAAQLGELAKRYLKKELASVAIVTPKAAGGEAPKDGGG